MLTMISRDQWRRFIDNPIVEWTMFVVGILLIIVSPAVGVLPGPGGIVVFGLGLAMVLKTSMWAKRRYVKFKSWQPKAGRWTDWGLRRESARRREAIRKEEQQLGVDSADEPEGTIASLVPDPPAKPQAMPVNREG